MDLAIVLLSIMGITLEEIEVNASLPINPTIIRIMRVLRIARGLYSLPSYLPYNHGPFFFPVKVYTPQRLLLLAAVDQTRLCVCHPWDLCCFTDCSAEAVVCVERVQMAVMRNSVHFTQPLLLLTHTLTTHTV